MATSDNKATVERIYAALERGNQAPFGAACRPDLVWELPGHSSWSRRFEGQEAVRRDLLWPLFRRFAGTYTARAIRIIGEADTVVAEVRGDVTVKGGGRYDNHYCMLFDFDADGRIARVVEYCDTDLEERVLGAYPAVVAAADGVLHR